MYACMCMYVCVISPEFAALLQGGTHSVLETTCYLSSNTGHITARPRMADLPHTPTHSDSPTGRQAPDTISWHQGRRQDALLREKEGEESYQWSPACESPHPRGDTSYCFEVAFAPPMPNFATPILSVHPQYFFEYLWMPVAVKMLFMYKVLSEKC